MGNMDYECPHRVAIPPSKPLVKSLESSLKETFFPDDPFRQFKNQPLSRKFVLALQYFVPILEWAPRYTFDFFKSDVIAGITIASLAVPQGISYANLANLPPIIGLCKCLNSSFHIYMLIMNLSFLLKMRNPVLKNVDSSFVPPLVYAMLGSSKDLAVGTVAVASLLISSMLGKEVNHSENPTLYLQLALTSTFFAGVFQASLGLLRSACWF
jgi:sulfate transporter 3